VQKCKGAKVQMGNGVRSADYRVQSAEYGLQILKA